MQFIRVCRLSLIVAALVSFAAAASGGTGSDCQSIADSLKTALEIKEGFSTQLRVEIKTVNTDAQAKAFYQLILNAFGITDIAHFETGIKVRDGKGQSFQLRDVPSNPTELELVTSTNYLFPREVQDALGARVRIRDYGVVFKDEPLQPWVHDVNARSTVSLEIKAQTDQAGVVVKPIVQMDPSDLGLIYPRADVFAKNRPALEERLRHLNPGMKPEVITSVLDAIAQFHALQQKMGLPPTAINIQYHRRGFVLEVMNLRTGALHKVQITFDQLVGFRPGVDGSQPPLASAAVPYTSFDGSTPAYVIEMKTDLQLNADYETNPQQVAADVPLYTMIRHAFEGLQAAPLPGYSAGHGKASQLSKSAQALDEAD